MEIWNEYWPMFLHGLYVTVYISAAGMLMGSVLSLIIFALGQVPNRLPSLLVAIYISFFRGNPVLILAFLCYYVLPMVLGIDISVFWASVLALGLNTSAFTAEILRAGLSAVHVGQFEAGTSLGMNKFNLWRHIIIPQIFYKIIPPLTSEFIILIRATPALSAIALVELTRTAQIVVNDTYHTIAPFVIAAILYFIFITVFEYTTRILEVKTLQYR